ncbi:MAG: hypothetical protein GX370_10150 [Clostridia bacterium]|nr:hypothetical protein [Clostridia bacterium]
MKKFLYATVCTILIIFFIIQGKLILYAEREKEKVNLPLANEKSSKLYEEKEEEITLNRIMMLLYSKNRQYEVKSLSFKEDGRALEVEVHYLGNINHMREEFKDLLAFSGFEKVRSYQEDDSGLKKLYLSFALNK